VKLAGGVLLHPGFAREQKNRSELENPPSLFLTPEMIDKLLALGLPMGVNKDSPYTSQFRFYCSEFRFFTKV
jgi:hypothetical protein